MKLNFARYVTLHKNVRAVCTNLAYKQ